MDNLKMSFLNYTKLLKHQKKIFYGNKISIHRFFCYHKKKFPKNLPKNH